jgi:predicted nucleotidyltransferase
MAKSSNSSKNIESIRKNVETVKKNIDNIKKNSESDKKSGTENYPSLTLKSERDIAMDFAQKLYQKFDKLIKSVILFGSSVKHQTITGSDIDIIIIVDDASIRFDDKLILWYREELAMIIQENPYKKDLHINTVKLTTWWQDLSKGDPTIINILRYGDALIDFGGFFNPLKILLEDGKIQSTPEAIYTCLNRVPFHISRSKLSQVGAIEGCYWSMVDSSQALLMTIKVLPPSPEHIATMLKENFVDKKLMKLKHVQDFKELHDLHKRISHGEIRELKGDIIDIWQKKSEEYFEVVVDLIKEII